MAKSRKTPTKGKKSRKNAQEAELPKDDVDVMMERRNKVNLNPDNDSDDSEAYEFGQNVSDDDVIGLNVDSDEDGQQSEEEDLPALNTSESVRRAKKKAAKAKKVLEETLAKESANVSAWGSKRSDFYDADYQYEELDVRDEENKEARAAEEEEAKRLQQAQANQLGDADFGFDDLQEEETPKKKKKAKRSEKPESGKKKKERTAAVLDALENLDVEESDEDDVEHIHKNVSRLSKAEKLRIVKAESPELLKLLKEFQSALTELKSSVEPLMSRARAARELAASGESDGQSLEILSKSGMSFLELKFHLLLNYCLNIAYYLLLKTEGGRVKSHPVIQHLVSLRTYMEKCRPLDKKLQYQIEKLVRLATTSEGDAVATSADSEVPGLSVPGTVDTSALRFRPRPDLLLSRSTRAEEREADSESEEEGAEGATYHIPKMQAVPYAEKGKKNRREDAEREKARRSAIYKTLEEQFSEAPLEEQSIGALSTKDLGADYAEQERHEEDTFTRAILSKDQKKALARREREAAKLSNALQELEDMGDLALSRMDRGVVGGLQSLASDAQGDRRDDIMDDEDVQHPLLHGQKQMSQLLNEIDVQRRRNENLLALQSVDANVGQRPQTTEERRKAFENRRAKRMEALGEDDAGDNGDFDGGVEGNGAGYGAFGDGDDLDDELGEAAAYYDEVAKGVAEKKRKKKAKHDDYVQELHAQATPAEQIGTHTDKREASLTILKNRGLTRKRRKIDRNPRKKLREKFADAEKRRRGQVREMRDATASYGGEETGIKSNVSRSVRLRGQ